MRLVEKVLSRLESYDARAKASKVYLGVKTIRFLGMKLSEQGWDLESSFVESVVKCEKPDSISSLRSFIGLCNWQRVHIWRFGDLIAPLNELCKKKRSIKDDWGEIEDQAFEKLKQAFIDAPRLAHPDYSKPFTTYSDASDAAIGGYPPRIMVLP